MQVMDSKIIGQEIILANIMLVFASVCHSGLSFDSFSYPPLAKGD
jgi:hypothetical protein